MMVGVCTDCEISECIKRKRGAFGAPLCTQQVRASSTEDVLYVDMSLPTSYPWALAYGAYFYVLFQLVYLVRFGSFNMDVNVFDMSLYGVGVVSVLILLYFAHKLTRGRGYLLFPFVLAAGASVVTTLGGGLLGFVGAVLFGLIPFAVILPLGYWVITKFTQQ